MMGKKLNPEELRNYKDIYLRFFRLHKGLKQTTVEHIKKEYPNIDIKWDYYQLMWRKDDELFAIEIDAIKGSVVNWVENKLFQQIEENNINAMKFWLERKGGYTEKTEHSVTNNNPVELNIITPSNMTPIDVKEVELKKLPENKDESSKD